MNQSKYLDVAIRAARAGGKELLKRFNKPLKETKKSEKDIITDADLASEKVVLSILKKNFPTHKIYSEEAGENKLESDYFWSVDPLDGTGNFSRGIPLYGVMIGMLYKNEPVLGVIFFPSLNLLLCAEKGKGAYANGKRTYVSQREMKDAYVQIPSPFNARKQKLYHNNIILKIQDSVRMIRSIDAACFSFGQVALGQSDAGIFDWWFLHDVLPGIVIVREAGGKVTDWEGNGWNLKSKNVIASNKIVNKEFVKILSK